MTGDVRAIREGAGQHALRIVGQLRLIQFLIREHHDVQCVFDGRRIAVVLDGKLRAVDGRNVRATTVVVVRRMDFVRRQRVHDIAHALCRIRCVFAVRILVDHHLERVIRFAQRLRIALAHVLAGEAAEQTQVVVEVDHALEVVRVGNIRVTRVQLDEAVDSLVGGVVFAVFPVAVGDVDLRLLGKVAERIATLKHFEVFRALAPVATGQGVLRLRI
jgi:hypothetical protein